MPITKSAKKALRQSVRRHARNLQKKDAYKRVIKNVKKFVAAGKMAEAEKLLPRLYKTLDKAAKTHAVRKHKASRFKSRMTKLIAGQKH